MICPPTGIKKSAQYSSCTCKCWDGSNFAKSLRKNMRHFGFRSSECIEKSIWIFRIVFRFLNSFVRQLALVERRLWRMIRQNWAQFHPDSFLVAIRWSLRKNAHTSDDANPAQLRSRQDHTKFPPPFALLERCSQVSPGQKCFISRAFSLFRNPRQHEIYISERLGTISSLYDRSKISKGAMKL